MDFTIIPLALALLGPINKPTNESVGIQNETKGCFTKINSETNRPVSIMCDEDSNLLLNPSNSSQILVEFIRQNNIETIESVHTSWTEGK